MSNPRRPSLAWRLFVIAGMGTSIAVATNDEAWEKWKGVAGETIPRETFKSLAIGAVGLHVAEAGGAYVAARRAKLDSPRKWALSTLLWGFPVHRRLSKTRRANKKALAQ
ncbi:MAG TPA: DUF4499 domain-containing protein [Microthrixaceae bacterium]|nr:DUF4499 domain-containing protein [Microthrixaceae bacterium]